MQYIKKYLKSPHAIGEVKPNDARFADLNRTTPVDADDPTDVTSVQFSDTRYFNYLHLPDVDCSTNPNYPDTNMPFKVSVEGRIGGIDGVRVYVHDIVLPIIDNPGGTQQEVGDCWVIIGQFIKEAPTHTLLGRYSPETGPIEILTPDDSRDVLDVGWIPLVGFEATPIADNTIGVATDFTDRITPGMSLRCTVGTEVVFGRITEVLEDKLIICGGVLNSDILLAHYCKDNQRQLCVNIPGMYSEEDSTELIVTILHSKLTWTLPRAHLVYYRVYTHTCDTGGSKTAVCLNINATDVGDTVSLEASTTWYDATTDVVVNTGDVIDISCIKGGNGDAEDLTVEAYFIHG